MSGIWSTDDKLFVDGKLGILSFDLKFAPSPSESLPVERRSGLDYNGPKDDKFKHFLSKMGYRVNNKGRVIVAVPRDDDEVEAFHYFLLEKVVPLGPFGFPNKPIPKNQQETILRAELAKKNDELDELRRQLLKSTVKLEDIKFDRPHVLVSTESTSSNFLGFCRRMNRIYVNSKGDYIKFEFTAMDAGTSKAYSDVLYYCDEDCWITSPFTLVQYDESSPEQQDTIFQKFYEPGYANMRNCGNPGTWLVNEALTKARNCLSCAFALGRFRFFRQNNKNFWDISEQCFGQCVLRPMSI